MSHTVIGAVITVLGLAEIGACFALGLTRARRGGGMAIGSALTAFIGLGVMTTVLAVVPGVVAARSPRPWLSRPS